MSQVSNRQQSKRSKKQKDDSDENPSDEDEQKQKVNQQIVDENKKTLRNLPIPVSTLSNAKLRTIATLLMLFAFILIVCAGPFYCAALITAITTGIFSEITSLKRKTNRDNKIPYFNLINWYFFFVGVFYFNGTFVASKISEEDSIPELLRQILNYHKFASFILWVIGFLAFVLSLNYFGWTHLTLFIVVAQTSVIIMNLYDGLVWFILPAMLVISNDIFAYIFGRLFGKTKLIQLSPNKTWEGFIGGFFSSLFFAVFFSYCFQQVPYLICENKITQIRMFEFNSCKIDSFFVPAPNQLPSFISPLIPFEISISQFQKHSIYLSLFASLIAPFGGFFASGFKRALQIKDFGTSIPGHGGLTDRMDCQLLMGTFTFCYLNYIVIGSLVYAAAAIKSQFKKLSTESQEEVLKLLEQIYQEKLSLQPQFQPEK